MMLSTHFGGADDCKKWLYQIKAIATVISNHKDPELATGLARLVIRKKT